MSACSSAESLQHLCQHSRGIEQISVVAHVVNDFFTFALDSCVHIVSVSVSLCCGTVS